MAWRIPSGFWNGYWGLDRYIRYQYQYGSAQCGQILVFRLLAGSRYSLSLFLEGNAWLVVHRTLVFIVEERSLEIESRGVPLPPFCLLHSLLLSAHAGFIPLHEWFSRMGF